MPVKGSREAAFPWGREKEEEEEEEGTRVESDRVGVDPSSTISQLCDWGISLRLMGLMRAPAEAGCENLMGKAPTQQVP